MVLEDPFITEVGSTPAGWGQGEELWLRGDRGGTGKGAAVKGGVCEGGRWRVRVGGV